MRSYQTKIRARVATENILQGHTEAYTGIYTMANKITLDTITSSFASTSLFNTNFAAIKSELDDKVLYRNNPTGEANQMENAIDMNSNDVLNARLVDADAFSIGGTLLTPESSLETLTYLDTEFTSVAGQDTFTVSYTPNFCDVYYNGVLLADADVTTTSGTAVVLATPVLDNADVITIRSYSSFSAGDGITQSNADARYLQVNNNLDDLQDASVARTNLGLDGVFTDITAIETKQAQGQNYGKNLIINGDFSVWQRGAGTFSADGEYTSDRWKLYESGGTATVDQQEFTAGSSDTPNNSRYYLDLDVTTGNDYCRIGQPIEDVRRLAGKEVTISFRAKGTNPGGGVIYLTGLQFFGSGGSPSSNVLQDIDTFTLTSSWQVFTSTFTVPAITGKTLGTNNDSWYDLSIGQGPDTSTDAWDMQISDVQLEFGDTATEFEHVSPADQLARCKRYFEALKFVANQEVCTGFNISTTICVGSIPYTVEKRAAPSITADFNDWMTRDPALVTSTAITFAQLSTTGAEAALTSTGLTSGGAALLHIKNNTEVFIDAEL
jgi:hypothetical protein